ncbi:MAG: S8 family peptidase [bacterium]|nr:MAG: S8 family peptidase [bacterium]
MHMSRVWGVILVIISLGYSQNSEKFSYALQQQVNDISGEKSLFVWVFFKDKGIDLGEKLAIAEQNLLPKARERRKRHFKSESGLVDFHDLPVSKSYLQKLSEVSLEIRQKSRWLNAVSVEVARDNLHQIATLSFVRYLDLVFIKDEPIPVVDFSAAVSPDVPENTEVLNYGESLEQNQQINVISLHNMGYDGSGVLIAMLDAGFNNLEHQALKHLNILASWDFVNGDSVVWDEPGQMGTGNHGTWTLSALAGFKDGFLIGPAYGADFLLAKTENTDWERHVEEDAWIAGAEWADSLGADIISSSLGYFNGFTNGDTNYTWQDMDGNTTIVTRGADMAAGRGILVVNSAGNEGFPYLPVENTLIGPADGDSVLAIGSVRSDGTRSSFSSMGPTVDGRIKPDVMARGSQTFCASVSDTVSYSRVSGTSLSCPLVAGAAALVLQVNPNFTNMDIIHALHNTASQASNPNNQYGWGIIDAFQAASPITAVQTSQPEIIRTLRIYGNYPNPFNPTTTITFDVPSAGYLNLSVYNLVGEQVTELIRGWTEGGTHNVTWNASNLSSGMYLIVLENAQNRTISKALLVK